MNEKKAECIFKDHCLECIQEDPFKCPVFIQWFKAQQNESMRSHARALTEDPFSSIMNRGKYNAR